MGKTVRRINREFDIRPKQEPYRKTKDLKQFKGVSTDIFNEVYDDDTNYEDDE